MTEYMGMIFGIVGVVGNGCALNVARCRVLGRGSPSHSGALGFRVLGFKV